MPKRAYEWKTIGPGRRRVIGQANQILESYWQRGFVVTLRQVYYQFVARDLFGDDRWYRRVENTNRWVKAEPGEHGATINAEPNYNWLGDVLGAGRMAGLIDWKHMEDRTRGLEELSHWLSPAQLIEVAYKQFRMHKWDDQPYAIEVWVEKEALVGVIAPICEQLDVPYFCCRGYTSLSEMWAASQRLLKKLGKGKQLRILHLGDHDPSGVDMSRDIEERLFRFLSVDHHRELMEGSGTDVQASVDWVGERFDRLALNWDQIQQYGPPPNPAKIGDSRSAAYIERFGDESWELDALEPEVLAELIESAVLALRDEDLWEAAVEREEGEREVLESVSNRWDEVRELFAA